MNEFVLKEKHKYWDNKITLEEYIKDIEESGYIDCTGDYEYESWYILENLKKINNLQSKIDKAIEYIDKHFQDDEGIVCKITGEYEAERNETFIKEILDILKEVE